GKFAEDGIAALECQLAEGRGYIVPWLCSGDIGYFACGQHGVIDRSQIGEVLGEGKAKGDIVGRIADDDHARAELEDLGDIVIWVHGQWRRVAGCRWHKAGRHTVPGGCAANGDIYRVG